MDEARPTPRWRVAWNTGLALLLLYALGAAGTYLGPDPEPATAVPGSIDRSVLGADRGGRNGRIARQLAHDLIPVAIRGDRREAGRLIAAETDSGCRLALVQQGISGDVTPDSLQDAGDGRLVELQALGMDVVASAIEPWPGDIDPFPVQDLATAERRPATYFGVLVGMDCSAGTGPGGA